MLGWCIIGPMSKYNLSSKVVRCNRIAVMNKAEGHIALDHFVVENSVKETDCKQMLLDMYEQEFSEPSPKQMRKKMQPANANGYISSSKDIALSKEDNKFLGEMEKGVAKVDGHYQLLLPFRHENVKMPDSRHQAVQHAMSMRKHLKDQLFYDDYVRFMKNIIEKGYAKKVALPCLKTEGGKVWYLLHHGTYHPKKLDKIRVVFDCSCQYGGRSLNKELLQSPDMTNSFVGVLSRFRQEPIVFMADIEAMFYQVFVPEEQQSYLHFLWWPDGNINQELEEYKMSVHLFVAISSPSCANIALKKTADDFQDNFGKEKMQLPQ